MSVSEVSPASSRKLITLSCHAGLNGTSDALASSVEARRSHVHWLTREEPRQNMRNIEKAKPANSTAKSKVPTVVCEPESGTEPFHRPQLPFLARSETAR